MEEERRLLIQTLIKPVNCFNVQIYFVGKMIPGTGKIILATAAKKNQKHGRNGKAGRKNTFQPIEKPQIFNAAVLNCAKNL